MPSKGLATTSNIHTIAADLIIFCENNNKTTMLILYKLLGPNDSDHNIVQKIQKKSNLGMLYLLPQFFFERLRKGAKKQFCEKKKNFSIYKCNFFPFLAKCSQ